MNIVEKEIQEVSPQLPWLDCDVEDRRPPACSIQFPNVH